MTEGNYEIVIPEDEFWLVAKAHGELLSGMPGFLTLVEADATTRRAVIAADIQCGIAAWHEMYTTGRDVCLAIEARIAADEALK